MILAYIVRFTCIFPRSEFGTEIRYFYILGWLVDLSGGYTLVFIVFGLVQIVGGLFILSIALLYKVRSQN